MKGKSSKIIISGVILILMGFIIFLFSQIFVMLKMLDALSTGQPDTGILFSAMKTAIITGIIWYPFIGIGLLLVLIGIIYYFFKEK